MSASSLGFLDKSQIGLVSSTSAHRLGGVEGIASGRMATRTTFAAARVQGAMHERASSRPRHRPWTRTTRGSPAERSATSSTRDGPTHRRRRRAVHLNATTAPDGDAASSASRLNVDDVLESLMSSSVRSRLLTSALDYSVEATMTDFPGANVDAGKGPPVAAAYLRKFLQENLGRNLNLGTAIGDDDERVGHSCASSPGGMLIATLDGLNLSASDDVAAIAAALRSLMLARLDVRCRALTHHRTHVITRGRDTNLVTSGANSAWTQSGARRKRSEMPPPSLELKETLALDDTAFARRVAEAHRTWRVARSERLEAGGKGGAEDASGEEASTPILTAFDVERTMWNLANLPSGLPVPSALRCTYDHKFMDSRFADDALP